jgi:uncharacterized membrane protein
MTQIKKVAVIGAGTMGGGIAAHCINAGLQVVLLDTVPSSLTPEEEKRGLTLESKEALTFRGKTTFAAIEPGRYLREEGSGDLSNVWVWRLTPEMSGTQVHVRIDYTVPGGALIGGILDKLFVERQNQKDLEQTLSNLKQMLEG